MGSIPNGLILPSGGVTLGRVWYYWKFEHNSEQAQSCRTGREIVSNDIKQAWKTGVLMNIKEFKGEEKCSNENTKTRTNYALEA